MKKKLIFLLFEQNWMGFPLEDSGKCVPFCIYRFKINGRNHLSIVNRIKHFSTNNEINKG